MKDEENIVGEYDTRINKLRPVAFPVCAQKDPESKLICLKERRTHLKQVIKQIEDQIYVINHEIEVLENEKTIPF